MKKRDKMKMMGILILLLAVITVAITLILVSRLSKTAGKDQKEETFDRSVSGMLSNAYILKSEEKDIIVLYRGETYLATPNMMGYLDNLATPKTIRLAVDSTGTPKLIGEPDIDPSSRANLWHTSLKYGVERGETTWVRIQANMSAGQYEIIESANDLGEPKWPNQSMEELINDAFSGRIIDSADHPFIRQIQGRV